MKIHPTARKFPLILYSAIALVFAACALVPYAFSDDYGQMLYISRHWTDWTINQLARDGRLITSFLVCKSFGLVGCLDNLRWLRLIAFSGILLTGTYLFKVFLRQGLTQLESLVLCVITCIAPGVGEYIGWAVAWPYTFLMFFIAWASERFCACVESRADRSGIALQIALGCLAIQVSMLIYQPIAGFFLIIPLARATRGKIRALAMACVVLLISYALYSTAIFHWLHNLDSHWCASLRAVPTDSPIHHISVLFGDFFIFLNAGWFRIVLPREYWFPIGLTFSVIALSGVYCIALVCRTTPARKLAVGAIILAAFALSAPQVFILDDIWSFRAIYPMYAFSAILAWTAVMELAGNRLRRTIAIVTAASTVALGAWAVNIGIVYSYAREYAITCRMLEEFKASGATKAYVILPRAGADPSQPAPTQCLSCYSVVSLALMRDYQLLAIMNDRWNCVDKSIFTYIDDSKKSTIPQGAVAIDLWGAISGQNADPNAK